MSVQERLIEQVYFTWVESPTWKYFLGVIQKHQLYLERVVVEIRKNMGKGGIIWMSTKIPRVLFQNSADFKRKHVPDHKKYEFYKKCMIYSSNLHNDFMSCMPLKSLCHLSIFWDYKPLYIWLIFGPQLDYLNVIGNCG